MNRGKIPKYVILVGPTGVGKTTTIAKLAAIYGFGHNGRKPVDVRMITIDNYRIGAKQQIDTYGSIMNIPVSGVESTQDLKKTLALYEGGGSHSYRYHRKKSQGLYETRRNAGDAGCLRSRC